MISITINNDQPCMPLCPCSSQQLISLPHEVLTSDDDWGPAYLDSPGNTWNGICHYAQLLVIQGPSDNIFDEYGELKDKNQQGMRCFDAFEHDYCEDINYSIDIHVEFHITDPISNHWDIFFAIETYFSCFSDLTFIKK